jgi:hypothetical protein
VLPALQRLQALQLGRVWGCLDLEDMLALAQLRQLEELYIEGCDIWQDLYCLLQRCPRLSRVVLHDCDIEGPEAMSLISKPGMQEVELRGIGVSDEQEERLKLVAGQLGVRLSMTCAEPSQFVDADSDCTSDEEGD